MMSEWRKIDANTPPPVRVPILACDIKVGKVFMVECDRWYGWYVSPMGYTRPDEAADIVRPDGRMTHWQPLPPPPTA